MNRHELTDDALDDLLRGAADEPPVDDGFVARTLAAIELAERGVVTPQRVRPDSLNFIARALAAQQRTHRAQARLWRWAIAGLMVGSALLMVAVLLSPAGTNVSIAPPLQWFQLFTMLAAGSMWCAWRELRS